MGLLDRLGRRTRPAVEPPPPAPASVRLVDGLEQAALAELTDLLDGTAVCKVPADRAVRTKRLEGRSTALADVRRALAAAPDTDVATVVDLVARRWQTGPSGPLWEAYREGGRHALAELADGTTT